jgi:hypothetical protein
MFLLKCIINDGKQFNLSDQKKTKDHIDFIMCSQFLHCLLGRNKYNNLNTIKTVNSS